MRIVSSSERPHYARCYEKPGLSGEVTVSTIHSLEVFVALFIRFSSEIEFLLSESVEPHTPLGTDTSQMKGQQLCIILT